MRIFVITLVLLLVIAGCTTPLQVQPTIIPSVELPTNTIAPIKDSEIESTATPAVKITSTLTPTITQTPNVELNLTAFAEATQSLAYDQYCDGIYGRFINDNWGICDRSSYKFTLFNLDGRMWQYSYEELGIVREGEGPGYWTRAINITKDGLYAFLMPWPIGYDPGRPFLGGGVALLRVNLENGKIHTILPPNKFYAASLSPTGRRMAYVKFSKPLEFAIQDLQTGEVWQTELDKRYTQAGAFVWSDDGLKVTYELIIDGDECTRKHSIRFLDIDNMSSTTIINDTEVNTCQPLDPTYHVIDVTDNSIVLEQHGDIWNYKISMHHLYLQTTATPHP